MVDNTTHIIYTHLFIIGTLGLHYNKISEKKITNNRDIFI